jgi:hypothetical protein
MRIALASVIASSAVRILILLLLLLLLDVVLGGVEHRMALRVAANSSHGNRHVGKLAARLGDGIARRGRGRKAAHESVNIKRIDI